MNIKTILHDYINPIKTFVFKLKWRKGNRNNYTIPENRFPMQLVSIGKATYGRLNVYTYNDPNAGKLVVGPIVQLQKPLNFYCLEIMMVLGYQHILLKRCILM